MDRKERRIKKQKRQKSIKRGFLIFVLVVVAFFGILATPLFGMKECNISGLSHYTYDEVYKTTGLSKKQNLFYSVKPETIENSILKLPYVDSVTVKKVFPNKVNIDVIEKTEIAAIPVSGKYVIVDKTGLVLRSTEEEVRLPYIVGIEIMSAWEGQTIELVDKINFDKAIQILLLAEEKDFYFERLEFANNTLYAYIYYDQYLCRGSADNILSNMDGIKALVYSQYKDNIVHGTIIVGANGYISFAP